MGKWTRGHKRCASPVLSAAPDTHTTPIPFPLDCAVNAIRFRGRHSPVLVGLAPHDSRETPPNYCEVQILFRRKIHGRMPRRGYFAPVDNDNAHTIRQGIIGIGRFGAAQLLLCGCLPRFDRLLGVIDAVGDDRRLAILDGGGLRKDSASAS